MDVQRVCRFLCTQITTATIDIVVVPSPSDFLYVDDEPRDGRST
jgi:hypothetical protein